MPRRKREDILSIALNYIQGNYSSIKAINHLIDSYVEDKSKTLDLTLHFINEAVIHKNPELWAHNFVKYEMLPKMLRHRRR